MLKTEMYPFFVEKFPGAEADGLLNYMFDYFDSRHLKGLIDHINDETDEEEISEEDDEFYKL